MRTLIVEDDSISRRVLESSLSPYGECQIAVNGKQAIEAFSAARKEGQRFDLICMDIMMPEMDGQEALKHIRSLEENAGVLPSDATKVIMTTALADFEDVITAIEGDCNGYLLKPIKKEKLLAELKSLQLIS